MEAATSARSAASVSVRRGRLVLGAAIAFELVIATVDLITGNRIVANFFLIAPVALAAYGTSRQVVIAGAIAVALSLASGIWDDYFLTLDHLLRVGVLAGAFALALIGGEHRVRAELAAGRLRVIREQLDRTLGALAEAVTAHDADGKLTYINPAALELMGLSSVRQALAFDPGELFSRFENRHEDGSLVGLADLPGRRLLRGVPAEPLLTRWRNPTTGRERWLLLKATQYRDDEGRPVVVNVIEDVTETKEAELRERFLARAGEVLSSSLDFEDTLRRVARLAVPAMADWCAVELVDVHGDSRQVAVAHVDPAKVEYAKTLRERYPPDPEARSGVPVVLKTGRGELYPTISDELLEASARDQEELRIVRELQMHSAMIVPMRIAERVIGAITFVAAETKGSYDGDDFSFAHEVAARAATAVENARLYRERSHIAETLQRSLLPSRLPTLPGWRSASLYRPADQVSQIGGDFFDLFRSADGFTVVLGDVTGKGVAAAAMTALVRHSSKTAALLGLSPAGILGLLNRILLDESEMTLTTVVCAHFSERVDGVEMTIASAGHPPPLRRRPGEDPVSLGGGGVLLGVDGDGSWPESTYTIAPRDTLLFYTDGVTDTPGADGRFGEARLSRLVGDAPSDPDALITSIDAQLRAFQRGTHVDDTAMLALTLVGEPVGDQRAPNISGSAAL